MAAVTPNQALADLQKGKAWPVYCLYGDEPYKIREFIDKLTEGLFGSAGGETAFCLDKLDGSTTKGADVLDAVQSVGLFAGRARRLVIVRQAHLLKETEELARTLMNGPKGASPWGENVLVLVCDSLDGRRKFHQWLKKAGYALEFRPARDAELMQWVSFLARKLGVEVDAEAARVLAVLSEGSLHRLAQEIEKAWLYAGAVKGTRIATEHVAATAGGGVSHEMVELVDAILEGKRMRALLLCERLITGAEDALGLVGFLTWAMKNGRARGGSRVRGLLELDERLKSSGQDPNLLVQEFIIGQTRPGSGR